jgi:hypothetical protein
VQPLLRAPSHDLSEFICRHAEHPDPWVSYVAAPGVAATLLPELAASSIIEGASAKHAEEHEAAFLRNMSAIIAHMAKAHGVPEEVQVRGLKCTAFSPGLQKEQICVFHSAPSSSLLLIWPFLGRPVSGVVRARSSWSARSGSSRRSFAHRCAYECGCL